MRISDWSSDVCSSDLRDPAGHGLRAEPGLAGHREQDQIRVGLYRRTREIGDDDRLRARFLRELRGDDRFVRGATVGDGRSEERRVGTEWVSTVRSRGAPYH